MENKFKRLDDRRHILARGAMYIGSTDITERTTYIYENGKIQYKTYECVQGLIKIIDEIIDNSVDALTTSNIPDAKIKVNITNDSVTVIDNGPGIPVVKYEDKYIPELCWNAAKTGTNFEDDNRAGIGMNGVGSYCTNVYSSLFKGISDDGKNRFTLTCKNNAETAQTTISKSKERGVTVTFYPDLPRFNLSTIDETHQMLVHQRLINLSVTFPNISFYFNNKKININTKQFISMFSDGKEIAAESPNCIIGILPNEYDDFKYYTYVNGISILNGGNHIDYVCRIIVDGIRDKLIKKHKGIKPGDIKNKLQLVLFMKNFPNPKFNSQTKDELTNSQQEIAQFIDIDFDKLIQQILKNKDIIEPMVEMFKLKEELKSRKELKNVTKKKKINTDKYIPPIKNSELLMLCEGNSAQGSLSAILGRENYGYYAMKGVPLNGYDCTSQKITSNEEIKEIVNILDLDLFGINQNISFNKICIAADADADGSHITGLLLGLFYRYAPHLFENKRIYRLKTPIIMVTKKGKIVEYFFTIDEYRRWEENGNYHKGLDLKYLKGLGAISKETFQELIHKRGIEYFLEYFTLDDIDIIDRWLSNSRADDRKDSLSQYKLELDKI